MSHYTKCSLKITSAQALVAALIELRPRWAHHVEVHEAAQTLYGWHGEARPEKAHIIIRRQHTGLGASNDVGFLKQADGTFTAIVSDYDRGCGLNQDWLRQVTKLAGVHRALNLAKSLGHRVERRTDQKGRPQLVVTGGRW